MKQRILFLLISFLCLQPQLRAQNFGDDFLGTSSNGQGNSFDTDEDERTVFGRDTSRTEHSVPTEFYQWNIDERLGTIHRKEYNDTLPHLFQNFNATEGLMGEYSILGNLGSPRMAINFLDREIYDNLIFMQPFDYFHTTPSSLLFTNTKSPLTNLQYHKCGTSETGQDRFRAYFASNIKKCAGLGFKIDYLYGRGYYNNQANSQFGGTVFGYFLSDHYDVHAVASWEHMKMGENGGIEDDRYITDPQSFPQRYGSKDIPTVLSSVWNRNDQQSYFLTHRYKLGMYRDVELPDSLKPAPPTNKELLERLHSDSLVAVLQADTLRLTPALDSLRTAWENEQVIPREFVPVTSFVHTLDIRNLQHETYVRTTLPDNYFSHAPYYRSSYSDFQDETKVLSIRNTLGVQLHEGFNRWAKAGIVLYASDELNRFRLPSLQTTDTDAFYDTFIENNVTLGGDIKKTQGRTIHYNAGAEFWVLGQRVGDLDIHGGADLNFRLGKDTVRLAAKAYFKNLTPSFFFDHFQTQTTWWDNEGALSKETRTRIEGTLSLDRTRTSLRFGVENISNYTYLTTLLTPYYATDGVTFKGYSRDVAVRQQSGSVQVLSATLRQDIKAGIFHWDNAITWQHSSNSEVLPLPMLSIYTNPYIVFHVAKVLRVELGADMRFFTKYYAPDYAPFVGLYTVQDASQERVKVGNWPILNGYANFAIKRVRGYINVTHFNSGSGNAFWAPHYPIDPWSIHFGISWNFYD